MNMKRRGILTIAALLLALGVAACGKPASSTNNGGGGNSVPMGPSTFSIASITIKAGQTVHFDDSNGGYHVLCIGKDQQCTANATGPSELTAAGGHTINVGQTWDVTFPTAGTYEVTCTVHSNMNVTITVTP
jgi:plastocyanin